MKCRYYLPISKRKNSKKDKHNHKKFHVDFDLPETKIEVMKIATTSMKYNVRIPHFLCELFNGLSLNLAPVGAAGQYSKRWDLF